ncbi:hypothetical protein D6C89_10783 [Aureobasidium pullulans]|nr:hypothetical protein D6C89_10783 [Aureobasidium pullulans]
MHLLGPTIEKIAWHKSGIFKSGTPAFSSPQSEVVADVLRQRAADKSVTLEFVEFETTLEGITYSWLPDVQKMNCSLALALANTYMRQTTDEAYTPMEITKLLAACETPPWPGRFHCIHVDGLKLYIDGAHNESGIVHAVDWFANAISKNPQDKNLQDRYDPEVLERYQKTWKDLGEQGTVSNFDTIEEALKKAKELGRRDGGSEALVLGSLKLVEGILCMIERSE